MMIEKECFISVIRQCINCKYSQVLVSVPVCGKCTIEVGLHIIKALTG